MAINHVTALIIAPPGRLRDSLRVLLRASDVITRIEQADDGQVGLLMIAQYSPDFVFLSANLPDEETWAVLAQLQSFYPQIHCCVLVHNQDQEHRVRAAGVSCILPAGFSAETLHHTIKELINHQNRIAGE